ncbi:twin-arginine translocation pathway signal [Alcaligenaceae bacterium]|nr:twin-arginine translocation pathway signal [Alcaligenaceae bacterium]
MGKDNWLFYSRDNLVDTGAEGIANSVRLMQGAQDALSTNGVGLIVVVAPLKARFYEDKLPSGQRISAQARNRYKSIIASLQAANIKTIDLTPILKAVEQGEQTAFLQKDSHWTAWSAEASGKAVADLIQQDGSLKGEAGGGAKLGEWVKERRYGDFAELMTSAQRKAVGQQIYTVRASKESSNGLLDNAETPVHIVGNSFVQPYLGFPQALSAALDRPVGLTWKYGNFGPWAVLLDYLKSPTFKQAPPQLVVWQLNEAQILYGPNARGQWDATSLMTDAAWLDHVKAALSR